MTIAQTVPPGVPGDPVGLLVGGDRITTSSGAAHEHIYPATGQPNATIVLAGAAEIDRAVASAREAQREWVALTADRRRDLLIDLADAVLEEFTELSTLNVHDYAVPIQWPETPCSWSGSCVTSPDTPTNPTGRTHRSQDRSMSISSSANPTASSASSLPGTVPWLSRGPASPRRWPRETQ